MNAMQLLTGPFAQALGWALLHLVWQATIVAGILAAVLALIPRRSANVRYSAACTALALVFALFVTTTVRTYDSNATPIRVVPATAAMPESKDVVVPLTRIPMVIVATAAASWRDRALDSVATARQSLPSVVAIWLMGVVFLSGRLLLSWLRARSLIQHGTTDAGIEWQRVAARLSDALGLTRAVRILESAAVEVPSVLGSLRPVILLPASTLTGLTPEQIEMVLAHELAHIRRHDFLVNLMQAFVETLMFYHPAVWWMSRRVRIERENCCDDMAVTVCGDPIRYAKALTRLEELRAQPFTIAVAANGGSLLDRIRRIAGGRAESTGLSSRWFAAVVMLVILAFAVAFPSATALAQRDEQKDAPKVASSKIDVVENDDDVDADPDADADIDVDPDIDVDINTDPGYDFDFDFAAPVPPVPPAPMAEPIPGVPPVPPAPMIAPSPMIAPVPRVAPVPPVPPVAPVAIANLNHDFDFDFDDDAGEADRKLSSDGKFTVDELISMRAVGVTPEYIKAMRAIFPDLSLRQLTSMRAVGVEPDDIRTYRAAGIAVNGPKEATSLRAVGVTPAYIEQMRAAGFAVTTAKEATSLRAVGVTPEYVKEMRDAGFTITSAKDATSMRAVGVTPEWVREMRDAGVRIDSAKDATSMRAVGVDAKLVARLAAAGYTNLSARELSRLAASGIDDDFIREMDQYREKSKDKNKNK